MMLRSTVNATEATTDMRIINKQPDPPPNGRMRIYTPI
ncbi:hypothetical protein BH20ACT21_BH20ACT21_03860 [soil metagenome]